MAPPLARGLDVPSGQTEYLWNKEPAPQEVSFDLAFIYRLNSKWCGTHGPEFCEAIVTGKRPQTVTQEERLNSHYESLSRVIQFTRTADRKAAPVLAIQVALAGTLAARLERLVTSFPCSVWDAENALIFVALACYGLLALAVVGMAAWVYMPRNPRTGKSLIFFEDIAAMDFDAFVDKAESVSTNDIERQLLDQIHRVSRVASTKMTRVRWALWLSGPSLILWVILLAWGN